MALLTGKEPHAANSQVNSAAAAASRRMTRRGSEVNGPYSTQATTYIPPSSYSGGRPSWNHQMLQSFFRGKPSSLFTKKRSSSPLNWVFDSILFYFLTFKKSTNLLKLLIRNGHHRLIMNRMMTFMIMLLMATRTSLVIKSILILLKIPFQFMFNFFFILLKFLSFSY